MKKLFWLVAISLIFYFNPITTDQSFAFMKNAQEKCIDRILKKWNNDNVVGATKFCVGANSYSLQCTDRILKRWGNDNVVGATKFCKGSNSGTKKCVNRILDKWNNNNVVGATKICLGT